MSRTRWGVVGAGRIARKFTADVILLPDHEVTAVGSRDVARAAEFAADFPGASAYGSYEQLVADPDVDVVYVATPHPMHHEQALLALGAGKPVLVEKPFAINAGQAREMVAAARAGGLFAMEAMWTRFLPHIERVRAIIAAGTLGDLRSVIADHGQRFLPPDPTSRLYAPELGGGALLDLGIYPVSFASLILGTPTSVTAVADLTDTAVDAQTSILLTHAGNRHAVLHTTLGARTPTTATVSGTQARIEIATSFYRPTTFQVISHSGDVIETWEQPDVGNGLRHQAAEVGRCLQEGRLESALMPLDETVAIMETMDEVRRQVGLRYPFERSGASRR
jgi:predicted dehydrogenase